MAYDPFSRGPHPVGVRSETWNNEAGKRSLDVEIWYPATADFVGADLDPGRQDVYTAVWTAGDVTEPPQVRQPAVRDATPAELPGRLILFAHGYAGHRREASYLCTHLASHGYVVVSADHPGSTSWEIDELFASGVVWDLKAMRRQMGIDRKVDVPFMVAEATSRGYANDGPVGVVGISLGGWTAAMSPEVEKRVTAIMPLCPAGGLSPIDPEKILRNQLDFAWSTEVSCLHGVASRDSWLPLYGQFELFSRMNCDKRMVILLDADHNHFCDDIEVGHEWFFELTMAMGDRFGTDEVDWPGIARTIPPITELVSPEATYALWRGAAVAHFDSVLGSSEDAARLLDNDLVHAAKGLGASVVSIKGERT